MKVTEAKREYLESIRKVGERLYDKKVCKECGGECCKGQGCMLMPFDIEPFEKVHIIELLENGEYSIRAFYEENMAYPYMIAREVGQTAFAVLSPHTRCAHLTKKGCKFSDEERPTGGIAVIPNFHGYCLPVFATNEVEGYWKSPEVHEVMTEVVRHYIGNHSLTKFVRTLFAGFEHSMLHNTCSYNFYNQYCIYHNGLQFGYHFKPEIRQKFFPK